MSREDVRSATKCPVEFIYPFAQILIREIHARVQEIEHDLESQFFFGAAGGADTKALEASWATLHDIEVDMRDSLGSLTGFAAPGSSKTASLIVDFDALMRQIGNVRQELRDYLARHVSMKSLEESRIAVLESRKSIELADSVRRLTQLAFVFIPLNMVTSLFGMNMVEFGTGTLHIWVFVAVALGLSLVVGLAVFIFSRRAKQKRLKA